MTDTTSIEYQIEVMQAFKDGAEIESSPLLYPGVHWKLATTPTWNWDEFLYRVKQTKPSCDWSHVADGYNFLSEESDIGGWFYETEPTYEAGNWFNGGDCVRADILASYKPGNCNHKDSLVRRPK